jgi:hypothetical protein
MKNDDISAFWLSHLKSDFACEDVVPFMECRLHGDTFDLVRLNDEKIDDDKK